MFPSLRRLRFFSECTNFYPLKEKETFHLFCFNTNWCDVYSYSQYG